MSRATTDSELDCEHNVKPPATDAEKMNEYVRRLRYAWCNPSDKQASLYVNNFENRIAPEFVRGVLSRIYGKEIP